MLNARRAVIDVGTNSVKLLVAEVQPHTVNPVTEKSWQTRLGRGFYETHRLQAEAIEKTAQAVAEFAALARQMEAVSIRVIATSAARDAVNRQELTAAIQAATGLRVEVISGEQEAEWAFRGVSTDPNLADQLLLILEVGGGSTQLILGQHDHHSFRQSFPIGAVRLLEKLRPGDPPSLADLAGCRRWLTDFFNQQIAPALESSLGESLRRDARLVGAGGTSTVLACMALELAHFDRQRVDGTRLSRQQVLEFMVHLWSRPLAERKKIIGLPSNRADIILMGVAIYEAVLAHFDFPELYISTRGVRFGAILDAA